MKNKKTWLIGILALAMGCQSQSGNNESIAVETNDLGITHVEIEHTHQAGDRLLVIHGLDQSDQEIALATLRTGIVLFTPEPDVMPEAESLGTALLVTVGDASMPFVNPSLAPNELPPPWQASIASFVALRVVADALGQEAGIRFKTPPQGTELAFTAGNCNGGQFPTKSPTGAPIGSPLQCCSDPSFSITYHKINGGSNNGKVGVRVYGGACTNSNGSTGCSIGGTGLCLYGPCGGYVQDIWGNSGAWVFHPTSFPLQCGADLNDGGVADPPSNTNYYPAVTATCPYVDCLYTGKPTATVNAKWALTANVTVVLATGHTFTSPAGVDVLDVGSDAGAYASNQSVTVTADPNGNARGHISGACTANSASDGANASCNVTMSANQTVTVTYDCPSGGCPY